MIKIEYPPYQPAIKKEDDREMIFDTVRKRWVVLTPEEWVRQNFLQYIQPLQIKSAIWVFHYPTVAKQTERLRICLHTYNHEDEITALTDALNELA